MVNLKGSGGLDGGPCTGVADVQLCLHTGSPQLEQGLSLTLLPVCGSCSPNWTTLSSLSERMCLVLCDLMFQEEMIPKEDLSVLRGEGIWGRRFFFFLAGNRKGAIMLGCRVNK